jgi:hypothetical protein
MTDFSNSNVNADASETEQQQENCKRARSSYEYITKSGPLVLTISETGQLLVDPGLDFINIPKFNSDDIDKRTWAPCRKRRVQKYTIDESGQLLIRPNIEFIVFPKYDSTKKDKRTWAPCRKRKQLKYAINETNKLLISPINFPNYDSANIDKST